MSYNFTQQPIVSNRNENEFWLNSEKGVSKTLIVSVYTLKNNLYYLSIKYLRKLNNLLSLTGCHTHGLVSIHLIKKDVLIYKITQFCMKSTGYNSYCSEKKNHISLYLLLMTKLILNLLILNLLSF